MIGLAAPEPKTAGVSRNLQLRRVVRARLDALTSSSWTEGSLLNGRKRYHSPIEGRPSIAFIAQVLGYLRLSGCTVGLLINFNVKWLTRDGTLRAPRLT